MGQITYHLANASSGNVSVGRSVIAPNGLSFVTVEENSLEDQSIASAIKAGILVLKSTSVTKGVTSQQETLDSIKVASVEVLKSRAAEGRLEPNTFYVDSQNQLFYASDSSHFKSFSSTYSSDINSHLPSDPLVVSGSLLAGTVSLPGGCMGSNGKLRVELEVVNLSGSPATLDLTIGRHSIWAAQSSMSTRFSVVVSNTNSTKAQRCIRTSDGTILYAECDTDKPFSVDLFVRKTSQADLVYIASLSVTTDPDHEKVAESRYQSSTGVQTVSIEDYTLYPLPSRVTSDPLTSIRSLSGSFVFPSDFFGAADIVWPFLTSTRSRTRSSLHRTHDRSGLSWFGVQTEQATSPYGDFLSSPAGISPGRLAELDTLFQLAHSNGMKLIVNLLGDSTAAPGWLAALGFQNNRIQIPAAGANRSAGLASLGFYVRFLCQRYTTLYPDMTWYIEPINEPNLTWNGPVTDLVSLVAPIVSSVADYGAGRVKLLCSSWTDRSQITFNNPGSPPLGSNTPTLHEYIGNGGWSQFDILTYHTYGGTLYKDNIVPGDPYYVPVFRMDKRILDPLANSTLNGNFIGLRQMLVSAGVGDSVVPAQSIGGGKELWMTEAGDAVMSKRDRNWFVWHALVLASLGCRHAVFYYTGNDQHGAIPSMDISFVSEEWNAAQDMLNGKTISFVNASYDLSRGAAMIDGTLFTYGI